MKLFNLNPTYLSKSQFAIWSVLFWTAIIVAIYLMKEYQVYGKVIELFS